MDSTTIYQTTSSQPVSAGATAGLIVLQLVILVVAIVLIVSMWKLFKKAGRPGWAAIIPFYNAYILIKIAGRPGWWLVLYLIPIVNLIIGIIIVIDIAKAFGKSGAWGFWMLYILSFIGYPILGFGSTQYQSGGNGGTNPAMPVPPPIPPVAPPPAA